MYLTYPTVGQNGGDPVSELTDRFRDFARASKRQWDIGRAADEEILRQRFYWLTLTSGIMGGVMSAIAYPMFYREVDAVENIQWASWGTVIGLMLPISGYSLYKWIYGELPPGPIQPEIVQPY